METTIQSIETTPNASAVLDLLALRNIPKANNSPKANVVPWLLPVTVAVSMVIFLIVSFCLHHKRFLQQRRRTCKYYVLEYPRVAGPGNNAQFLDTSCGVSQSGPEDSKTSKVHGKRLMRGHTWSPRVFKDKLSGSLYRNKLKAVKEKESSNEGAKAPDSSKPDKTPTVSPEKSSKAQELVSAFKPWLRLSTKTRKPRAELLTLAELTLLKRSNSCRGRAVVVTTSTGALAVANDDANSALQRPRPRLISDNTLSLLQKSDRKTDPEFLPNRLRENSEGVKDNNVTQTSCRSLTTISFSSRLSPIMQVPCSVNNDDMSNCNVSPINCETDSTNPTGVAASSNTIDTGVQCQENSHVTYVPASQNECYQIISSNELAVCKEKDEKQEMTSSLPQPCVSQSFYNMVCLPESVPSTATNITTSVVPTIGIGSPTTIQNITLAPSIIKSLRHLNEVTKELQDIHKSPSSQQIPPNPSLEESHQTNPTFCKQCQLTTDVLKSLSDYHVKNVNEFLDFCESHKPRNAFLPVTSSSLERSTHLKQTNTPGNFTDLSTTDPLSQYCILDMTSEVVDREHNRESVVSSDGSWHGNSCHGYLDASLTSLHIAISDDI